MTAELFPAPAPAVPTSVVVQYAASVAAATHLQDTDAAVVEAGRRLAVEIDRAHDPRIVATLTAQLLAVTDRLGLSPKGRRILEPDDTDSPAGPDTDSPLHELALIRASRRTAGA